MNLPSRVLAAGLLLGLTGWSLPLAAQSLGPSRAGALLTAPPTLPRRASSRARGTEATTRLEVVPFPGKEPSQADLTQRIVGASFGSLTGLFAGLVAGPDAAFIAAPFASVAGSALGSAYVTGEGSYWAASTLGAVVGSAVAYSTEGSIGLLAYSVIQGVVTVIVGPR